MYRDQGAIDIPVVSLDELGLLVREIRALMVGKQVGRVMIADFTLCDMINLADCIS
jgi:hypothetical protein